MQAAQEKSELNVVGVQFFQHPPRRNVFFVVIFQSLMR